MQETTAKVRRTIEFTPAQLAELERIRVAKGLRSVNASVAEAIESYVKKGGKV
jgi:DNA polymerase/3'-5' exonuclease PolX|tara:strand:- start:458 stop:616 length:159 start_codon:yes stop_codon:yes gene_type:complete